MAAKSSCWTKTLWKRFPCWGNLTPVLSPALHQYSRLSTSVLPPEYWSTQAGVLLPLSPYLVLYEGGFFKYVNISSPEQAFLECLLPAPKYYDYTDFYYITEQLTTLRSDVMQRLLENTGNYGVKRMFLCMAEKAGHYFDDVWNQEQPCWVLSMVVLQSLTKNSCCRLSKENPIGRNVVLVTFHNNFYDVSY